MKIKPVDINHPGAAARFWALVEKVPGRCWTWKGRHTPRSGYAVFHVSHDLTSAAHRWACALVGRPIPLDRVGDHLCRNRGCVRPSHIDAVTQAVNCQRGYTGHARGAQQRAKTHCPAGHPYSSANTRLHIGPKYTRRHCRACDREYA